MKMKKAIALSAAAVTAVSLMAGCGSNGDSGKEAPAKEEKGTEAVTEISFPTSWVGVSVNTEWFNNRMEAFNEEYGDKIKVNVEEIAGDQAYVDK